MMGPCYCKACNEYMTPMLYVLSSVYVKQFSDLSSDGYWNRL